MIIYTKHRPYRNKCNMLMTLYQIESKYQINKIKYVTKLYFYSFTIFNKTYNQLVNHISI